jgi:hypothetical protein
MSINQAQIDIVEYPKQIPGVCKVNGVVKDCNVFPAMEDGKVYAQIVLVSEDKDGLGISFQVDKNVTKDDLLNKYFGKSVEVEANFENISKTKKGKNGSYVLYSRKFKTTDEKAIKVI